MEKKKSPPQRANPEAGDKSGRRKRPMHAYYETMPQTIQVEQVLGANMSQRVIELDLMVPEKKPDIEQIIDIYVKNVRILAIDVLRDQVILRGTLEVKVMYVADLPDQPVHAFEAKNVRFTRDIEILGAEPGMMANADTTVALVDYEKEFDPREVHITIVLKMWARVIDTLDVEVFPQGTGAPHYVYGGVYGTKGAVIMPLDEQLSENFVEEGIIEQPGEELAETPVEIPPEEIPVEIPPIEIPVEVPEEIPEEIPEELPEEVEEVIGPIMKVKGRVVNVRSGPGTNFPVITKVNRGDVVRITDQAFGWYKATLPDGTTTGWIASWLLAAPKG